MERNIARTWSTLDEIPNDYREKNMYCYLSDSIYGAIYGDLRWAELCLINGLTVKPVWIFRSTEVSA